MVKCHERFDQPVSYTLVDEYYDNRILDRNRFHDVLWGDFVELMLTEHQIAPHKEHAKLVTPVRFLASADPLCQHAAYTAEDEKKGRGCEGALKRDEFGNLHTWRGAWNVESWWMLPVDIDGQQSIEQARAFFDSYTYVAYTSFNHMADDVTEKFRLFLLLEKPVPHVEFDRRRSVVLDWLGAVDRSSLSASRAFYLPCCPKQRLLLARRWFNEGNRCLDVMTFDPPVAVSAEPPVPPSEADGAVLIELLRDTFLGEYEEWWKVSVAMASAGFSLAEFKYVTIGGMMRKKESRDCERQWQKATASVKRGRTIHIGYLYNLVGGGRVVKRRQIEQEIADLKRKVGGE